VSSARTGRWSSISVWPSGVYVLLTFEVLFFFSSSCDNRVNWPRMQIKCA
jgi:hypothetical protein